MRLTAPCGCKTDYEIGFERVTPTNDKERPYLKTIKEIHYCNKHEPMKTIGQYERECKILPTPSCESLRRRYIAYAMRRLRPLKNITREEAIRLACLVNIRCTDSYLTINYKGTLPNEVKIKITSEQIAPDKAVVNVDVIHDDEWGV